MSTQWTDLLLRKTLDDSGQVPFTGGGWTNSPDIIPNGTTMVSDPNQSFGASTYGQDLGKQTLEFQQNYFYVRAKNLSSGADEGDLYLYYCPQNLFLFPSLWVNNQLKTTKAQPSAHVKASAANNVVVGNDPFVFTPTSEIHSCLIGRVTTVKNPNPLPQDGDFQTMDDLGVYICNHPDMAWRNVDLKPYDVPTLTNTFTIDTTALSADTKSTFLICISYNNLTIGSKLAFAAASAIPSGPDQGKVIQLVTTPVSQTSGSLGTSTLVLPGGWKTPVTYSYWAQAPIQKNWSVTFYAILLMPGGANDKLIRHAKQLHELGVPGLHREHPQVAALGNTMGLILGSVTSAAAK